MQKRIPGNKAESYKMIILFNKKPVFWCFVGLECGNVMQIDHNQGVNRCKHYEMTTQEGTMSTNTYSIRLTDDQYNRLTAHGTIPLKDAVIAAIDHTSPVAQLTENGLKLTITVTADRQ